MDASEQLEQWARTKEADIGWLTSISYFAELVTAKGWQCQICLSNHTDTMLSMGYRCNHVFHHSCLLEWLRRAENCPTCRRPTQNMITRDCSVYNMVWVFAKFSMELLGETPFKNSSWDCTTDLQIMTRSLSPFWQHSSHLNSILALSPMSWSEINGMKAQMGVNGASLSVCEELAESIIRNYANHDMPQEWMSGLHRHIRRLRKRKSITYVFPPYPIPDM